MQSFRLLLEYDGRDFKGWQIQPGAKRTVQRCLEEAVERICGRADSLIGSGRTDSGVHAQGQVVSLRVDTPLDAGQFQRALNGNLPRDIVVLSVEAVPRDFDARRHAVSKCYRYTVWNARLRSPLRAARSAHIPVPLDVEAMLKAAERLEGEHDFACFRAAGSDVESTIRSLYRAEVRGRAGEEIVFEFNGSGFLRHMVRNIVGTLVEVGRGARSPESIEALLASRNRAEAGPTAPAEGLVLVAVSYPTPAGEFQESIENSEPSGPAKA